MCELLQAAEYCTWLRLVRVEKLTGAEYCTFIILIGCPEPLNTLVFDDFSTQLNGSQTSLLQPSLKLGSSNQMHLCQTSLGVPGGSNGKESSCNARDPGSIPGLGRSPREGNGYPLQYSCLENSIERGDWLSN